MKRSSGREGAAPALAAYFGDLQRFPPLSAVEETAVARAARAGDEDARDRLVSGNLRFVVRVAKRYQNRGLPLEDLICEGNRGVLHALERYDPDRAVRFITYAEYWVVAMIERALEVAPVVRQPGSRRRKVRAIRQAANRLSHQLCGTPTAAEVAQVTGVDERIVADLLQAGHVLSLDEPIKEGGLAPRDLLVLGEESEARSADTDARLRRSISSALTSLPERDATILRLRFGLGGEPPMRLREVGERLGLSRQRVNQLEAKALARLRGGRLKRSVRRIRNADAGYSRRRSRKRSPTETGASSAVPGITITVTRPYVPAPAAHPDIWRRLATPTVPGRVRSVRHVVAIRASESSLDEVAAQVGVPGHALRLFMCGVNLPSGFASRLRTWYERVVPPEQREPEPTPVRRDDDMAPDEPRSSRYDGTTPAHEAGTRAPPEPRSHRQKPDPETPRPDMPPTEETVLLDPIRTFARERAHRLTERHVAGEIGISRPAFQAFLAGDAPAAANERRIQRWYAAAPAELSSLARDYRGVPLAELRAFFRAEVDRTSLRTIARVAGISHSVLDTFLSKPERNLQARTHRTLALHYLRHQEKLDGDRDGPARPARAGRDTPSTAWQMANREGPGQSLPAPAAPMHPGNHSREDGKSTDAIADLRGSYLAHALRHGAAKVAAAVPVPAADLLRFLHGNEPGHLLHTRLCEDHARRVKAKEDALGELMADLDDSVVPATARRILEVLAAGFEACGMPPPSWVRTNEQWPTGRWLDRNSETARRSRPPRSAAARP